MKVKRIFVAILGLLIMPSALGAIGTDTPVIIESLGDFQEIKDFDQAKKSQKFSGSLNFTLGHKVTLEVKSVYTRKFFAIELGTNEITCNYFQKESLFYAYCSYQITTSDTYSWKDVFELEAIGDKQTNIPLIYQEYLQNILTEKS